MKLKFCMTEDGYVAAMILKGKGQGKSIPFDSTAFQLDNKCRN